MSSLVCKHCGKEIDEPTSCCPECGNTISDEAPEQDGPTGSIEEYLQHLIKLARQSQHEGDLVLALDYARQALALRENCSTTHALLGHLYEQQGNTTASRHHFQSALQVTRSEQAPSGVPETTFLPKSNKRSAQSGIMMLVLIGCIFFSGLAAILAFRPCRHAIERSTVFQIPSERPPLASTPPWTWRVPVPCPLHVDAAAPAATTTDESPMVKTADKTVADTSVPGDDAVAPPPGPPSLLGPSAHAVVSVSPSKSALVEADQAYFKGEYDRAIMLYETILTQEEKPNPRLYQDLAWCYQQLGNSQKAAEYLGKAVDGYRALLETDPNSTTTQQALQTCTAALNALLSSRNHEAPMP